MDSLRLFVWDNALSDYAPGIIVALAPGVAEARQEVPVSLKEEWHESVVRRETENEPRVYDTPVARVVFGGG